MISRLLLYPSSFSFYAWFLSNDSFLSAESARFIKDWKLSLSDSNYNYLVLVLWIDFILSLSEDDYEDELEDDVKDSENYKNVKFFSIKLSFLDLIRRAHYSDLAISAKLFLKATFLLTAF